MTGLTERLTKSGIPVLRLHYSADPHKNPETEAGKHWLEDAIQGYPGGLRSPRWRKEMEVDYGALGGTKLFPDWEQWSTNGRIVIPPFTPHGYRLYGSYDHGWRHPACYLVHGLGADGQLVTLWELFGTQIPLSYLARAIKGEAIILPDGRRFPGNPFAGQEVLKVADPSIWAEDKPQSDNTNKSTAYLFGRESVHFAKAERGGDTTVAEWPHGHWWKDPMNPSYRITTACPNLIREIGLQRHKDFTAQVAANRAQPEELVDKDNDAWDSDKYFLLRFPPKPVERMPSAAPNTFGWWRKQAQAAQRGEAVSTYQRQG